MTDRGGRRRADRRRQRGREDEAGRVGAHGIDEICVRRDITAETAEGLGERALYDIDTRHRAVPLGDPAAPRPIHTNGVNFVDIGQCPVALRQIADAVQRRNVTVHVQAFTDNEFWPVRNRGPQQLFQMNKVAVMPYLFLTFGKKSAAISTEAPRPI